jgi:putative ABC transport system permease protein
LSALRRLAAALAFARHDADRTGLALSAVLVAVTACLAVALPRGFDRAADQRLAGELTSAGAGERDLAFSRVDRIAPEGPDSLGGVARRGQALVDDLPASVGSLVQGRTDVVSTIEYLVIGAKQPISKVRLRIEPGAETRIRYVEGRAPTAVAPVVTLPDRLDRAGVPFDAIRYEGAIPQQTADTLRVGVGDQLLVAPELDTGLRNLVAAGDAGYSLVEIVGIYEPVDPTDRGWFDDLALQQTVEEVISIELSIFHATVLLDPAVYPTLEGDQPGSSLADADLPLQYEWRVPLDPTRLDAAGVDALAVDVQRLQAAHPFRGATTGQQPEGLRTGLGGLLARYATERGSAERALLAVGIGPVAAAAGAIALIALLAARRRRSATLLVRARGGSTGQVLAARTGEAVAIVVPAVLVGSLVAVLAVGARTSAGTLLGAFLVAAWTIFILVAVALPDARSTAHDDAPRRAPVRALEPRRLVLEGGILALAVASVVALRGRGIGSAPLGTVDPFLAAAPALVGLAASVVALRAYPVALAAVAATVGGSRGPIVPLAVRSAARGTVAGRLPILVVLTASAMAVLASILLATLEQAQAASAWREVGADIRIEAAAGRTLPPQLAAEVLPGIATTAGAYRFEGSFSGGSTRQRIVDVLAIDVPGYEAITAGSPVDPSFPASFHDPAPPGVGGDAPPIPAVISASIARTAGLAIGDPFSFIGSGMEAPFVVTDIRASGVDTRREDWVQVPLARIQAASRRELRPQTVYATIRPGTAPALRDLVAQYASVARMTERQPLFDRLAGTPLMVAVRAGFAIAVVVALGYSALALWAALALAIASRRRDLALLRTMGLSTREVLGVVMVEQGPLIIVGLVGGVMLGLALAVLLVPAMGLEGLAGTDPRIDLVIDPLAVALIGVVPIAAVSVLVLLAAWATRRADLARAVRVADR